VDDLIYASATALAQAIRRKVVTSREVVDAYLQRIETVNPALNAVVQLTADSARAHAQQADAALAKGEVKGPLHGVPFTVKDNVDVAGVICTAGTTGRASFVPSRDATVVARLRGAGAIVLGKTNLPELALAFETDNLVYGRTNNPYDLSRTPGGSSGGEASVIAAGGSPLGLGNDMGGSVRVPAHFCGITAIKPTTGRIPKTGHFPWPIGVLEPLYQPGVMARFVEDLVTALPLVAGVDWRDPATVPIPLGDPGKVLLATLKVAYHMDNGLVTPTSATMTVVEAAAEKLADAGLAVEEERPPGLEHVGTLFYGLGAADGGTGVRALLKSAGTTEVSPWLDMLLHYYESRKLTTAQLGSLLVKWARFQSALIAFMKPYDVILGPTCAYPAPPHGGTFGFKQGLGLSYTMAYNLTGWPGVTVPLDQSPDGLPIGVQIVARPWREDVALAVALCVEAASKGYRRPQL
jgi:amidase